MTDRRLADTNLLVRHLVQDHPQHAKIAGKLFSASDRGELTLVVLPAVLAECVFVLESFYKHPRGDIARVVGELISSHGVELVDLGTHLDALERYGRTKLHFVDCTLAATAARTGLSVATLDAGLKKFSDVSINVD